MEFALEFLDNLIYVRSYICIGELFFDLERKNHKFENVVWIGMTFLTSVACIYAGLGLKAISHLLCVMITLCFFFAEKMKTLVGLYVGGTAILLLLLTMIKTVISEFIICWQFLENERVIRVIANVIVLLFIQGLGKYYKRKYPNGLKAIGISYLFFFALVLLGNASILLLFTETIHSVEVGRKWLLIIIYIGVVIGIFIQIILLINALITRNVYKENEALAKQYLDAQKEHYLYLEKREYETKKFRHDIKNHLMVLENCISTKEYAEAEKYLNTLNEKVNAFGNHISVNNGIADAILNKFYLDAQEKGIALEVKGHFPLECNISAFDICTVLSNLLSNAILAESQCGGGRVSVDIRYTLDEVMLMIENYFNHELQRQDGVLKTTKQDSSNHGFGLNNVKECVEKAGGWISITTKDNRFKVLLGMKNEQKETI